MHGHASNLDAIAMADDAPGRADVEAQEVHAPRRPVDAIPSRRHSARNAEPVHCIVITTITTTATGRGREKHQRMGRKARKSGGGSGGVVGGAHGGIIILVRKCSFGSLKSWRYRYRIDWASAADDTARFIQ